MSIHMPSPSHHEHMMHMALYPIHADADAIMSKFIAHVAPIAIMSCSESLQFPITVTIQFHAQCMSHSTVAHMQA